ncbi:MAG: hypothetical protein ACYDEX_20495 [Mobilitalea sp.]
MRTHSSDEVFKFLIIAMLAFITCMLVYFWDQAANDAKGISESAITQMEDLNKDIMDSGLKKFDDEEVYGSEVINCFKKYLGDYTSAETAPIYIYVKTSISENSYTNSINKNNIDNFSSMMFIKPTALFNGNLIRNTNDIIIGISFVQK